MVLDLFNASISIYKINIKSLLRVKIIIVIQYMYVNAHFGELLCVVNQSNDELDYGIYKPMNNV